MICEKVKSFELLGAISNIGTLSRYLIGLMVEPPPLIIKKELEKKNVRWLWSKNILKTGFNWLYLSGERGVLISLYTVIFYIECN